MGKERTRPTLGGRPPAPSGRGHHRNQEEKNSGTSTDETGDMSTYLEEIAVVERIARTVAANCRITFAEISGKGRTAREVLPRQMAMFLARKLTSISSPVISDVFHCEHTTVLHAEKLIGDRFGLALVLERTKV